jgi:collagen type VII alpha
VANRRISEFSSIPGLDIDEQDLLTLVHVFEVDPVLRNKKITFTEFKNYLDLYYPSTAGGTFSGNVLINGNLTVTGTSTFTSLTSSNLGTFSGIVVQNNAIVSGTVSGNTVTGNNVQASIFNAATGTFSTVATGTTAAFTTGAFVALTGITTQGTSATYTNGTFTNLTGTTITGTTVNATTGNFQEIVTPSLNVANLTVSGLTVTGTAIFASGVTVTGTLSGTTVTGTTAQFTNVTGVSGVFTSQVSGAVITGDTVRSTTITGVSGTFTSSVSGATVTGNTGAFSNLTGVSGVFTQRISGDTITGNTILLSNVTGVSGVFTTQVSGATLTGNTVNATFLNAISGDFGRVSGTTITGNAGQFTSATGVSGVFTTQLSGATITGNIGQFASLTGATGTFTTSISGTTVTGDTIKGTNITGIAGVFTTSVSGSTITGNTIQGTSGVFQNISGNTITGTTISAGLVQAISGAFTNIVFINTVISGDLRVLGSGYIVSGLEVSGQISGYTVTATGGNFTSLTGTTTTGTNANFATGTFQVINATTHNVSGNLTVTGALGVSGTATFATGVNVSGTLSGVTVTGSTAQFTTGTFISLTGTTAQGTTSTYTTGSFTSLTGTTTTGTTANFASGVFTTSVSGTTVIASTGTFTSLTGTTTQGTTATYTTGSFTSLTGTTTTGTTSSFTSGVFTTLSGATATFTSGIIASGTAAAPSLAILGDPDTGVFSPGANQLAVATNGSGRLFVNSNGDIGLGTSSPDVFGRFYTRAIGLSSSGSTSLQINAATGSNAIIDLGVNSARTAGITSNVSETQFTTLTATPIIVGTNGGERVRITSAGLVGVGTSSPSQTLHVSGGALANNWLVPSTTGYFYDSTGQNGIYIYGSTNGSTPNILSFNTNGTERLRVDASGRVGIGTSSPSQLLHLNKAGSSCEMRIASSSADFLIQAGDAGDDGLHFYDMTNTAYRMMISNAGNVGIGTISPGNLLHVSGTGTVCQLASSNNNNLINLKGNGATNGVWLGTTSSDDFVISSGASVTERARIDSSGRLLVGTSTVTGFQTGVKHIFMDGGGASYSSVSIGNPGGAADNTDINLTAWTGSGSNFYTSKIRQVGDGSLVFHTQASSSANGAGSPVERLTIASNGNILVPSGGNLGINGASPQSPLDVISNASSYGISLRGRSADNSSQLRFAANNHGSVYAALESAPTYLAAQVNGIERLRITSAGLVGIGSSSPGSLLELSSAATSAAGGVTVTNTNTAGYSSVQLKNTGASGRTYTLALGGNTSAFPGSVYLYDDTAGATRFLIDSSGRLGIGNTDPGTLLTIGGSASSAGKIWLRDTSNNNTLQLTTVVSGTYNEIDSQIEFNLRTESGALRFTTNNTERGRWTSDGKFLVGTSTAVNDFDGNTITPQIQFEGTSLNTSSLSTVRNSADTGGPKICFGKSRSASVNGRTIVQSGDNLGEITFEGANGTDFIRAASIKVDLDGTPGANDMPGRLVFSTTADGASSPTERMRIDSTGYIRAVGTSSTARIIPNTDNVGYLGQSSERWQAVYAVNGTIQTSDRRQKTDITEALLGSDFVKTLKPVSYKWIEGGKEPTGEIDENEDRVFTSIPGQRTHWGFIAQDVKEAVDAAGVDFGGWLLDDKDDPDSQQALRYDQFIAPLTKALQEALAEIDVLKAKVAALEAS